MTICVKSVDVVCPYLSDKLPGVIVEKETVIVPARQDRFKNIRNLYELITPLGGYIAGSYAAYLAVPDSVTEPGGKFGVEVNFGNGYGMISSPSDVDIFVRDEDAWNDIYAALLAVGCESIFTEGFTEGTSVTLNPPFDKNFPLIESGWEDCPQINLIRYFQSGGKIVGGTPDEIIDTFDFTVARACLVSDSEVLVDSRLITDFVKKQIRIIYSVNPVVTLKRYVHYCKKGFNFNYATVLQVMLWIQYLQQNEYRENINRFIELCDKVSSTHDQNFWAIGYEHIEHVDKTTYTDKGQKLPFTSFALGVNYRVIATLSPEERTEFYRLVHDLS